MSKIFSPTYKLVVLLLVIFGCASNKPKVVDVYDGDTFELQSGEKVRLLGINTPEIGEPGADIAKDFLEKLVLGKEVRLEKVLKLKNELDNSKWVRPELLEEYTQLYLEELQIATQEKYFIAKIPLVEKKKEVKKWAECVSIGSQLAYFETLDRTFTGVCRNTNPEGPVPRYEFIVELPRTELMEIRDIMAQYRPEDYEQRIRAQLGEEVELVGKRPTAAQQRRAS